MQVEIERSTWEMSYPWPPFHQVYQHEPGLHLRLSPQECDDIVKTISIAMSGAGLAVANVLGAFAGVLPLILSTLVRDDDGGLDIHLAPHGFQAGKLPAADPNVWINCAWLPVAAFLRQLPTHKLPDVAAVIKQLALP
ncbi:MAG: hypothetical protein NTW80_05755, partial [Deltaproteobacteria bacterium]|nr:hypothetical protein [Deltaproteobacteria bacterium]